MFPPEIIDKPGCRVHHQGGAADDQGICLADGLNALADQPGVQAFFIQHHIRLNHTAAFAPGNSGSVLYISRVVKFPAALAVIAQDTAVDLIDFLTACRLMKPVDILGDHRQKLPGLLKLGQLLMSRIGLCVQEHHLTFIEFIESLGVPHKEAVAYDLFRRVPVLLVIDPVRAPEIRDPALRGHSRPAKEHDPLAVVDDLLQFRRFFLIHKAFLPSHTRSAKQTRRLL